MLQIAKLIGGPGTGKTAELLRLTEKAVEKLSGDPLKIGFVSFTRAARREASSRAAEQFGVSLHELEREGWFRTLHSTCKQLLGIGKELLTDNAESRKWVEVAIGEPVGNGGRNGRGEDGYYTDTADDGWDAARALHLWNVCRNRLEPLEPTWRAEDAADARTPPLPYCLNVVEKYEQSKRLDHRPDFVDLLGCFAGFQFDPRRGVERCAPEGDLPPRVEAWFLDEQQDVSPLLDAVCKRLIHGDNVRWAYMVGDPYQSIFGWAGADHHCFLDLDATKTRVMPCSYRCGDKVLALGERIIAECAGYFDRHITPANHECSVESVAKLDEVNLKPSDDWLILARTNFIASQVESHLDNKGIPHLNTHGGGKWRAPSRNKAIQALASLQDGAPIDGSDWVEVLKHVPSRDPQTKTELLNRGTKSDWEMIEDPAGEYPWVQTVDLPNMGATDHLIQIIRAGKWSRWLPESQEYLQAVEEWGQETAADPKIKVGTIHSAKGTEADNVLLLTSLSGPCIRSAESSDGADEQRRLFYVGVTRARFRLVILDNSRERKRMQLPEV